MRLIVHDHAGHPFQVQLARELARRGHQVLHLHCATVQSAKGGVTHRDDDPPSLSLQTVSHRRTFSKYSYARRLLQELEYGCRAGRRIVAFAPDVVLSCNTPLLSQAAITYAAAKRDIGVVAWVQDLYSAAAHDVMESLPQPVRLLLGRAVEELEAAPLRASNQIVSISTKFTERLDAWHVDPRRVHVIPNWPVLTDVPVLPKDNPWARAQEVDSRFVFLYTGILGLKHDPSVLLHLAEQWQHDSSVVVLAVAEGPGAEWLNRQAESRGLGNLRCLDFQPNEMYAEVLASGDVLVALLTEQSARYSVPSKVLSYLCAQRPILAIMPTANDAAQELISVGAGAVIEPSDVLALSEVSAWLRSDSRARERLGRAGRRHAEAAFDIEATVDRFEAILDCAARKPDDSPIRRIDL